MKAIIVRQQHSAKTWRSTVRAFDGTWYMVHTRPATNADGILRALHGWVTTVCKGTFVKGQKDIAWEAGYLCAHKKPTLEEGRRAHDIILDRLQTLGSWKPKAPKRSIDLEEID